MGFRKLGEAYALGKLGKTAAKGFNWSQFATFEAGLVTPYPTGWDAIGGAGVATLLTTAAAAIRGNYGASVGIPGDSAARFGQLTGPDLEKNLTFEALFDPNSITMADGDQFEIIRLVDDGLGISYSVFLRFTAALSYHLQHNLVNDAGGNNFGSNVQINDEATALRAEFFSAPNPGDNNGYANLFCNGVLGSSITNIDNDTRNVITINVGAIAGVDAGTNGTVYFDNVRWASRFI